MRITKKVFAAFAGMIVAVGAVVALNATGTQAISSYRNCNADAIIKCGAITETELLQDYDNNVGDVKHVYSHYGISRSDIAGTTSQIKHGTVYQNGNVVVEGKTVATGAYSVSRVKYTSAGEPRTVTINGTTYYEGPSMAIFLQPVDAFVMFRNGQFYRAVLSACGNPLMATPVKPPVQPVYSCDSLKATKITRTEFKFTSAATAKNGAEIVNYTYDFGDGKKQTTGASVNHTYAKPGNYTVTVTVNVKVNGVIKPVTGAQCKVTIKVEAVPVKPLYACNSLTAQIVKAETRTYEYTLSYTAEGGATLKKVVYNFGDSTTQTYDAAKASKVQHSYASAGSYKTTATLYFNVNNGTEVVEKVLTCEVAINVVRENCTMPGKEHLPKNSPECAEKPEVCEMPGKQHLPKNSPECVVTPPELPQTGLGGMLSGGMGLGSIAAAGYYWVNSRKSVITALYKR
jgi:hypothetical protein